TEAVGVEVSVDQVTDRGAGDPGWRLVGIPGRQECEREGVELRQRGQRKVGRACQPSDRECFDGGIAAKSGQNPGTQQRGLAHPCRAVQNRQPMASPELRQGRRFSVPAVQNRLFRCIEGAGADEREMYAHRLVTSWADIRPKVETWSRVPSGQQLLSNPAL